MSDLCLDLLDLGSDRLVLRLHALCKAQVLQGAVPVHGGDVGLSELEKLLAGVEGAEILDGLWPGILEVLGILERETLEALGEPLVVERAHLAIREHTIRLGHHLVEDVGLLIDGLAPALVAKLVVAIGVVAQAEGVERLDEDVVRGVARDEHDLVIVEAIERGVAILEFTVEEPPGLEVGLILFGRGDLSQGVAQHGARAGVMERDVGLRIGARVGLLCADEEDLRCGLELLEFLDERAGGAILEGLVHDRLDEATIGELLRDVGPSLGRDGLVGLCGDLLEELLQEVDVSARYQDLSHGKCSGLEAMEDGSKLSWCVHEACVTRGSLYGVSAGQDKPQEQEKCRASTVALFLVMSRG